MALSELAAWHIDIDGKTLRGATSSGEFDEESTQTLLMFIHGAGGQFPQFFQQFAYFSGRRNVHLFAINSIGHGSSDDSEDDNDFDTDRMADHLHAALSKRFSELKEKYSAPWKLVLIGHSLGTCLTVKLNTRLSHQDQAASSPPVPSGIVLICPKSTMTEKEREGSSKAADASWALVVILRYFDRMGGAQSHSVNRMLGPNASEELRLKQLAWNASVKTITVLAMAKAHKRKNQWAPSSEFEAIKGGVLLIGGEVDKLTPPVPALKEIHDWVSKSSVYAPEPIILPAIGHQVMLEDHSSVNSAIEKFVREGLHISI
ncbi:Alpha/Beta hydrolase protein [Cladochytrium replicatum]|nr:Alpha/Beta hydrolase protein [Cladochytrium replicatum]